MGRFDFGFGFGFGGHREQCLYTKPRATSQQTVFFFGWGGWGGSTSTSGWRGGASSRVFFEGGGGKVRLRVRWSLRAMCAQSPAHHPSTPFFVWRRRVGEVRLRVRRRVRWSSRAMSVQSLVHHPSKPVSFCGLGGLGRFDFGFGFGFVGHCEEFPYKARCIIPTTFFFLSRGGWGGSTSGSASGSASGSMVISSNVCTKPGASCQQTFGAWGGSTSGSALGTRLLSNRNIISSAFGTQSSVRQ